MSQSDTNLVEIELVGNKKSLTTKVIVEAILLLTCCSLPVFTSSPNVRILWFFGVGLFMHGLFTFFDFLKANRLDRDGIQAIVPLEDAWEGSVRVRGTDRNTSVKAWFLRYKLPDGCLYQTTVPEKLYKQVVLQNKLAVIYWPDNPEIQRIES